MPKGYGAEMAECQRYYIRIPAWQMIGVGYCDWEGKHVFLMLPTASTMRINPTVGTLTGTFYFGSGTTASFSYTPGCIYKTRLGRFGFLRNLYSKESNGYRYIVRFDTGIVCGSMRGEEVWMEVYGIRPHRRSRPHCGDKQQRVSGRHGGLDGY